MYGKTIELFLLNGTFDSLVTAELSNWNGKAIKIPRVEVDDCYREDISGVGIYFLICQEDGKDAVYIGETENIKERLDQHLRDYKAGKEKYYWHTALIFIGRDLNKALIRYLEYRLVDIAIESERYLVLTKNTYKNTFIKEAHIANMEEFIENVKILVNTLGYKILTPFPKIDKKTEYLYCKSSKASATGFVSTNGFVVVKGSEISASTTPSFQTGKYGYFELRNKLINEGVIKDNIFVRDYEFSSPSAASTIVLGNSSNGNVDWKNENKVCLRDI